jgi:hypothetical protein
MSSTNNFRSQYVQRVSALALQDMIERRTRGESILPSNFGRESIELGVSHTEIIVDEFEPGEAANAMPEPRSEKGKERCVVRNSLGRRC